MNRIIIPFTLHLSKSQFSKITLKAHILSIHITTSSSSSFNNFQPSPLENLQSRAPSNSIHTSQCHAISRIHKPNRCMNQKEGKNVAKLRNGKRSRETIWAPFQFIFSDKVTFQKLFFIVLLIPLCRWGSEKPKAQLLGYLIFSWSFRVLRDSSTIWALKYDSVEIDQIASMSKLSWFWWWF